MCAGIKVGDMRKVCPRWLLLLIVWLPLTAFWSGTSAAHGWEFVVDTTFIDMHTGPGRGFPKFYSIAKGEKLTALKQRTSWVKVETTKGRTGWIRAKDLQKTRTLNGRAVRMPWIN